MPVVTLRQRNGAEASRLDTLRSTVKLAGCSMAELRSLLQYVDEITVPSGTRIAVRGETCSQFVIVAEGRLRAGSPDDGWCSLVPGGSAGWGAMWAMGGGREGGAREGGAR